MTVLDAGDDDCLVGTLHNSTTAMSPIKVGAKKMDARLYFSGFDSFPRFTFSQLPRVLTMATKSQRSKGWEGDLSSLNVAIETMNHTKKTRRSKLRPALPAFFSLRSKYVSFRSISRSITG